MAAGPVATGDRVARSVPVKGVFDRPLHGPFLLLIAVLDIAATASKYVAPFVGPWPADPIDPADLGFRLVAEALFFAATMLALTRASTVRLGWLLLLLSFTEAIWSVQFIPVPALYYLSDAFLGLQSVVLAHIIVAFPSGRISARWERRFVAGLYVYIVAGAVARLLVFEPGFECSADEYCPRNPFAILADGGLADALARGSALLVPLFAVVALAIVVRHWRRASTAGRTVLVPLVVSLPLTIAYQVLWYISGAFELTQVRDLLSLPIVNVTGWILPAGFLLGVLRARSARASLPGAVVELGALPTSAQLEAVLRRRLGDPELQVVRWSGATGGYLDRDGRPIEPPEVGAPRRLIPLERDGAPVAGVILDAVLDDPGLSATIAGLVGLTVDATDLRDELRARGGDTVDLPDGVVTFLFGDVEGSTGLLNALGTRYADVLIELRRMATEAAERLGGRLVDAHGDEIFLVFTSPDAAVAAAMDIQDRLARADWPEGMRPRLRIGLHTGRPERSASGYVGLDVHRAARVMSAAHGGQIVASAAVMDAAGTLPDASVRPLGRFALPGLPEPLALVQIEATDASTTFPPLRAEPAG
jgi:class 3 adenylate cyclase